MALKKNDDIELYIDSVTPLGSAVGRYNGMAVFVRNAVPGDRIAAHIIKTSKNYAVAIIKDMITPSECRIVSDCPVSDKCGGCSFRNMDYKAELAAKKDFVQQNILRIGHIDFKVEEIVGADDTLHYRNKAQYPVRIENGAFTAGFYAFKSHRVVPADDCRIQPKEFEKGIKAFEEWALETGVDSYDEKTGRGLLRHVYFRKAFATGEVMACAVINGESLPKAEYLVSLLRNALPGLKSVAVNINKNKTNVILGEKTKIIRGSDKITDILLGKKFVISPGSFYQVNHAQCERLYSCVAEFAELTGRETVLDMYCGAGTIGLTLADKCKMLYGVEIVDSAVKNARENAEINGIENAEFICADAFEGAKILTDKGVRPDVVIVDPPRKGCQKELFDIIDNLGADKIVYVSCNSATLARDLEILHEKGYCPKRLKAFDLFPRTAHVESCCLLVKTDDEKDS